MRHISSLVLGLSLLLSLPSRADVEIVADVVYGHKDGMALFYDVLKPENANGAGVAYMISGGWFSRWSPPQARAGQFSALLSEGFTVFAVHHGSAPRYKVPEAYADVSLALRHIKLHASDHGIDADRLGVMGGSAGGHLSLMLGLNSDAGDERADEAVLRQDNHIAAIVAYFPPVDLRPLVGPSERFPALDFESGKAASISPILFADRADPPTLLIHGDADTLVPISNSEIMQAEFRKQGVVSDFITIPGAGHGFRGDDAVTAWNASVDWFSTHLLD